MSQFDKIIQKLQMELGMEFQFHGKINGFSFYSVNDCLDDESKRHRKEYCSFIIYLKDNSVYTQSTFSIGKEITIKVNTYKELKIEYFKFLNRKRLYLERKKAHQQRLIAAR